jgi:hypothetical protein
MPYMGVKLYLSHWGRNTGWDLLRISIFGPTKLAAKGRCVRSCIIRNLVICKDETDGVCGVDGTEDKCIQALGRNTWTKEIPWKIWAKIWENDVLKGIWKEYDGECVDCMHLSQDGVCKHSNITSCSLTEREETFACQEELGPWSWLFSDNDLVINYSAQIRRKVTTDVL